jgi:hypothetical protein
MFTSGRRFSREEIEALSPDALAEIVKLQIEVVEGNLRDFGRDDGDIFVVIGAEARVPFIQEGS